MTTQHDTAKRWQFGLGSLFCLASAVGLCIALTMHLGGAGLLFSLCMCFIILYFIRRGFLDGRHGFMLAMLYSFYTSAKYIRLWERQLPENPRSGIRNQGA